MTLTSHPGPPLAVSMLMTELKVASRDNWMLEASVKKMPKPSPEWCNGQISSSESTFRRDTVLKQRQRPNMWANSRSEPWEVSQNKEHRSQGQSSEMLHDNGRHSHKGPIALPWALFILHPFFQNYYSSYQHCSQRGSHTCVDGLCLRAISCPGGWLVRPCERSYREILGMWSPGSEWIFSFLTTLSSG